LAVNWSDGRGFRLVAWRGSSQSRAMLHLASALILLKQL
jgi:hypothetical protein